MSPLLQASFSIFLTVSLLLRTVYCDDLPKCISTQRRGGEKSVAEGNIFLEDGEPLEIFCSIDLNDTLTKGYTSKDIIFSNDKERVDQKFYKYCNETTAQLLINRMSISDENYYCTLPAMKKSGKPSLKKIIAVFNDPVEQLVCLNHVVVGYKPKEVTDFNCVSYNWEILNCTWKQPNNGIETNYKVSYQIPEGVSETHWFSCPTNEKEQCVWTLHSMPPYIASYEYLKFLIQGTNIFGNMSQYFHIHHYANLIPAAPRDLEAISSTPYSIYLQFNIGVMKNFEKGLIYKVRYYKNASTYHNIAIYNSTDIVKDGDLIKVNVTGLKYANTLYSFAVYMKSVVAVGDTHWSKMAILTAKTKAIPPYGSPEMDIGSFEITREDQNCRDVVIYWIPIPEEEYNGDNFWYDITVFENDHEVNLKPVTLTTSYAKFVNLSSNSYRFSIKAANSEGHAPYSTSVRVPSSSQTFQKPISFTKFHLQDNVYELSWKLCERDDSMCTDSTVFWLERYQGDFRLIKWQHLNHSCTCTITYNVTAFHSQNQFAISINHWFDNSSSGMFWAKTTEQRSTERNKVLVIEAISTTKEVPVRKELQFKRKKLYDLSATTEFHLWERYDEYDSWFIIHVGCLVLSFTVLVSVVTYILVICKKPRNRARPVRTAARSNEEGKCMKPMNAQSIVKETKSKKTEHEDDSVSDEEMRTPKTSTDTENIAKIVKKGLVLKTGDACGEEKKILIDIELPKM